MQKFLTTILLAVVFFSCVHNASAVSGWQSVGIEGFTVGTNAQRETIKIDANNIPYVMVQNCDDNCKLTVMTWNGSSWENVGSANFTPGSAGAPSMALDSTGKPYVAFADNANSDKLSVMRWTGSVWENVGFPGITSDGINYPVIALDSNDTPYVAFQDGGSSYQARVVYWSGTSWENFGGLGFSGTAANSISMVLDANDYPYVAFADDGDSGKAHVMHWNGTSWTTIGGGAASASLADYLTIVLDANDRPYIAFRDSLDNGGATVMHWTGTDWQLVGNRGFNNAQAFNVSLVLNSAGDPYVAFRDSDIDNKTSIMYWTGTAWEYVGSRGFSNSYTDYQSIAIDSNDYVYVVYQDYINSDKAVVKTYVDVNVYESDETAGTPDPDHPGTLSTYNNALKTFTKDSSYWITNISGSNAGYDSQVFKFNKDLTGITTPKYTLNWSGHGDEPTDKNVALSIWNFAKNTWDALASQHCATDCDLTANVTGSKYNDGHGNTWIWGKADNAMPAIEIVDGSINFNSFAITANWKTNIAGDSELVSDDVPHDTWQEFLDNGATHNYDEALVTDHSLSANRIGSHIYYMVRSTSADDGVVTSDLKGPLLASCPFVFTYGANNNYNFITDASTSATFNIGFQRAAWAAHPFYRDPNSNNGYVNPLAYSQIPHDALVPRTVGDETYYDIKATTELNETDYFDEAKLQVVDHDASVNIYPDYRDNGQIHTISKTAPAPVMVTDEHGTDVTSLVAADDNVYWKSSKYADPTNHPSFIDIKLTNDATTPENLKLVIKRGKEGPFPTSQADISRETFQYKNADGVFVNLPADKDIFVVTREGAPRASRNWVNAEGVQTKVIDLSGLDIKDNTVRLSSISNIRQWDVDWLAVDTSPDSAVTVTTLDPYSADLHYRGISSRVPTNPGDSGMTLSEPVYDELTDLFVANKISGNATKYGDVTPLLTTADNKFVIMVQGDELALKYHVPEQAEGTERDFVYKTWDYQKAYSAPLGDTILPLPFNEMSSYPYHEDVESYPYDVNQDYIDQYNTRVIDRSDTRADVPPQLHHSMNTDYISLSVERGRATSQRSISGNISNAGRVAVIPPTPQETPSDGLCSASQILTQNLHAPSQNGKYNSYTRAIVTEAKILQAHMARLGFNPGPIDGFIGPLTDGAIKRMQIFLKTTPDGFVGPITRGLLNHSCGTAGLHQ